MYRLLDFLDRFTRVQQAIIGLFVVGIIGIGAFALLRGGGDDGPAGPTATTQAPSTDTAGPTDDGPNVVVAGGEPVLSGLTADLAITAPVGAVEMQVTTDASFASADWVPVADESSYTFDSTGYQELFVRFRNAGEIVSDTLVRGVRIDPDWDSVTGTLDGGPRRPVLVAQIDDDLLLVRVEEARAGRLVGLPEATFLGAEYDGSRLDDPGAFVISSSDDAAFGAGVPATASSRVTTPFSLIGDNRYALGHDAYITLPAPLTDGATYEIAFPDLDLESVTFTADWRVRRSPAVQVNQLGYSSDDPAKIAFLSARTGLGGVEYDAGLDFVVIDNASDTEVLTGRTRAATSGENGEYNKGDLTGAPVWELDFSALTRSGSYRVCVEGVGCGYDFQIGETDTWLQAAVGVARGTFHLRSGIELGEPYSSFDRPRPYHPDDGMVVRASGEMIVEGANGFGTERFENLVAKGTDEVVAEAWGGHFDAGDWDRRVQHLVYLRTAIELVNEYPEVYEDLDLNIPESGDGVPDLIDEGLWSLDLFLRMQMPDGAIRGGIEAEEHPNDDASWLESQEVFAYAPDPWSTYVYAGVAAQAAAVLEQYDAARAAVYAESAQRAWAWAESAPQDFDVDAEIEAQIIDDIGDQRGTAAAALFDLTGDSTYEDAFLAETGFADGPVDLLNCHSMGICDGAYIYAQSSAPGINRAAQDNAIESFRRNGDTILDGIDSTLYGWALENPNVSVIWNLGPSTPNAVGLARAYMVTGDDEYRAGAVQSASFSLGANPLNTSFLIGFGEQSAGTPLIVDQLSGGLPVWPGISLYGIHDLQFGAFDDWFQDVMDGAGAVPATAERPVLRSFYDTGRLAAHSEFTIFQSQAGALYTYGTLAGAAVG